jgi:hypothetical protein
MVIWVWSHPSRYQRKILLRFHPASRESGADAFAKIAGTLRGETLVFHKDPLDLTEKVIRPQQVVHPELSETQHKISNRDWVQGRGVHENALKSGHGAPERSVLCPSVDQRVHSVRDPGQSLVPALSEFEHIGDPKAPVTAAGESPTRELACVHEPIDELA